MSDRKCFEDDCIRYGTADAGSCVVCQLLSDAHAAGWEAGMREAAERIAAEADKRGPLTAAAIREIQEDSTSDGE